jgi:hypothetical protein
MALDRFPDVEKRIMIFNCRSDRPNRSEQLGEAAIRWRPADHYLLMGGGTHFLARSAVSSGIPARKLLSAENETDSNLFEMILELAGQSAVVVGMGNAKGQGLSLTRFFRNRSTLPQAAKKEAP